MTDGRVPFGFHETDLAPWEQPHTLIITDEDYDDSSDCNEDCPIYYCPSSSQYECPVHGGFDVCCDHPEKHIPL
jgi:hypothetical protein